MRRAQALIFEITRGTGASCNDTAKLGFASGGKGGRPFRSVQIQESISTEKSFPSHRSLSIQ